MFILINKDDLQHWSGAIVIILTGNLRERFDVFVTL